MTEAENFLNALLLNNNRMKSKVRRMRLPVINVIFHKIFHRLMLKKKHFTILGGGFILYINGCATLLLILIHFQVVSDRCRKKPCILMKHVVCEHSWHACFQHRLPLPVFKACSWSISNINQRNSRVWGLPTQLNQYKTIFLCNVLHSWVVLPTSGIHFHAEIVWRNMLKQEIRNYCLLSYLTSWQSAVNKLVWKSPCTLFFGCTRWRSWLRHCATSQ